MKTERAVRLSPGMTRAIEELKRLVQTDYPEATFRVTRSPDDDRTIHLMTEMDLEDTADVLDSVLDRVLELQIDEGLPVHVIPVRPREHILTNLKGEKNYNTKRDLSHAQP